MVGDHSRRQSRACEEPFTGSHARMASSAQGMARSGAGEIRRDGGIWRESALRGCNYVLLRASCTLRSRWRNNDIRCDHVVARTRWDRAR